MKKAGLNGWSLTVILVAAALILSVIAIYVYGTGESGFRHYNRYNARLAFGIFSAVFILPGLKYVTERGYQWVFVNQKYLMVGMLCIMIIHLGGIYKVYQIVPGLPVSKVTFIGGGLAYLMIFLISYFMGSTGEISAKEGFKKILAVGIYWIWFIFAFTYIGRISRSHGFIPLAVFTFLILFFRIWGLLRLKKTV